MIELGKKDAVHVATILVRSNAYLCPGDHVAFTGSDLNYVRGSTKGSRHGIVDPFMGYFKVGTPFLVYLCPGMTKNLRHIFDLDIENEIEVEINEEDWEDDGCRGCNS